MTTYIDNSWTVVIVFGILGLMVMFGAMLDKKGFFVHEDKEMA